jgi:hypothetical protein
MRKLAVVLAFAGLLGFAPAPGSAADVPELPPLLTQVAPAPQSPGWTAGRVVAVGVGIVAGVAVANATLPMAWGMVTPVIGAVAGGMIGNWAYRKSTEPTQAMLRRPASIAAEAPSLFQLASLTIEAE